LDVDGEEVDGARRVRLRQNLVERPDRDLDRAARAHRHDLELGVERGMAAGEMQGHARAGILGRRARNGVDLGPPPRAQGRGGVGLRLDQDAVPPPLLQMERLRPPLGVVGSHVDEIPARDMIEELVLQAMLDVVRKDGAPQHVTPQPRSAFALRAAERATRLLVLCPGTVSTRMTSPPSPSTTSRPTTWSGW